MILLSLTEKEKLSPLFAERGPLVNTLRSADHAACTIIAQSDTTNGVKNKLQITKNKLTNT